MMILNMKTISDESKSKAVPEGRKELQSRGAHFSWNTEE